MNILEKDFVPCEPSLALKELGFDEPCFANYTVIPEDGIDWFTIPEQGITDKTSFGSSKNYNSKFFEEEGTISAPTFSQAFRWFRKNHKLSAILSQFGYAIEDEYGQIIYNIDDDEKHLCYEEAELACLIKLIEIVKNKQ